MYCNDARGERWGRTSLLAEIKGNSWVTVTRVHGFIEQLELGLVLRIKGFRF